MRETIWLILSILLVLFLAQCGKTKPPPFQEMAKEIPLIQLPDGLYDFECMKGRNSSSMGACKLNQSFAARGSHSGYFIINPFAYPESYLCGYLGWDSSCYGTWYGNSYPYYYWQYYPGPGYSCDPYYLFIYVPRVSYCYW